MSITLVNTLNLGNYRTTNYSMVYNNYAYISERYSTSIPRIRKFNLNTFSTDSYLELGSVNSNMYGFAHDYINGYLYAITLSGTNRIINKINLSNFTYSSNSVGLNYFGWQSGAIDTNNNIGYWAAGNIVQKVNLSSLSIISTLTLPSDPICWAYLNQCCIDLTNGYLYATGEDRCIARIRLSDFSYVDRIQLNYPDTYEQYGCYALMFIYNNYLYIPAYGVSGGRLIKVRLSDFTRIANSENFDNFIYYANCDNNGCGYVIDYTSNFRISKINLDSLGIEESLLTPCYFEFGSFIDKENNFLYGLEPYNPVELYKFQIQCQLATPCQHTNESLPIGGDCETFSDPTTNFSKIRSGIEL
jgi:hypothetical protein